MARNAIESEFWTSNMGAAGHFVENSKTKVAYRSEMVINAIKGKFRTSKLSAGSHFVKKFKKKKWPEVPSKVSFGHPKWPPAAIL